MKKLFFTLSALALFSIAQAQQVTFSQHIAPIIYNNCTTCHRPGEIAPFPLTNYEEAFAYSTMIQYVTEIKYMPPWKADPNFSHFLNERYLTDEQIQLIGQWVADGAPQGDPALEPPLPEFPEGSVLGEPDLVLSFEEAYHHEGDLVDEYRVFVLPTGLTEDKDIAAVELRPGNTRIVHHALFSYDETGEGQLNDDATPEYGYSGFGGFNVQGASGHQFPAYVPGQRPFSFPESIGQKLPAGADLLIQLHYAPVPTDEMDSSSVNLFFKDEPVLRYVEQHTMLPFFGTLTNGPFIIQPNEIRTFHGVWKIEDDISLLGLGPHMHLLGKDWTVFLLHPNGDTTNLIYIPDWDFNWQGGYAFTRFIIAKAGSEIHAYATYDNTSDNPSNPNDPPQMVTWGEKTTDEMYYMPLLYVPYQPGDEDVIFNGGVTSTDGGVKLNLPENKLYPIFPNPSGGEISIGFSLAQASSVTLQVLDLQGKTVKILFEKSYPAGRHQLAAALEGLSAGVYFVNLIGKDFSLTEKLVVE